MLKLTITVGGREIDYSRYVDWSNIQVQEKINIPSQMSFSITPSDGKFEVPPQHAYVRLYSTNYDRTVFTGFITSTPIRNYLARVSQGLSIGGQLFRYDCSCTSDEWLLNVKAVPFIPAYINRSQGEILTSLANTLCPGFFDSTYVASGDIVPEFQYDPAQSWSEVAKLFADGSRYRYKVRDKQIFYQPYGDQFLGVEYDERKPESQFDPKALQTTVLAVPMVNDVTIIGDTEAGNNREDYFIGDGFTGNFQLHHKAFHGSSVVLLQESWNNQEINQQQWFIQDPGSNFDLSAGALNVVSTAGVNPLGFSVLAVQNGVEISGGLDFEAGEFTFNDVCEGVIGGLYTDTSYGAGVLLGGFKITSPLGVVTSASGASGINIQPWWSATGQGVLPNATPNVIEGVSGYAIGPPIVSQVNHTYVLQMVVNAPVYARYTRTYRTVEGEEFGGAQVAATGNVSFFIQDYDIAAATGFYYQPQVTVATIKNVPIPSFLVYALINNKKLNLTDTNTLIAAMPLGTLAALTGPSGLAQPSGLILPMLPPNKGGYVGGVQPWPSPLSGNIFAPPGNLHKVEQQLVLGNGFQLQSAQVTQGNSVDTLSFYAQTLPAAGTRIRFQSWEAQAAVSRLQDELSIANEAFVVGDDGIRSAIVTDLNPLPRTSEDCDQAALAFLKDRVGVFYNGTYTITSLSFHPLTSDVQMYPCVGRFLNVNAPRRDVVQQKFLVTGLSVTVLDAQTELMSFQFQFGADLYLEKVLKNFVDLQPPQVLTPKDKANPPNPRFTQNVDRSFLPDLNHVYADSLAIHDSSITLNVFDPVLVPIEVRSLDTNWGRGPTRDYIGTFIGPSITLPRTQFDQVWFMRPVSPLSGFTYGQPLPPSGLITSRRSKVIHVHYPNKPLQPIFISQNGALLQFDFNGDIRNIYGFEVRAASGQSSLAASGGYIEHVLVQRPVASFADLTVDLASTPFDHGFDFTTRQSGPGPGGWYFFAQFFNLMWSYSPQTLFNIGATGVGPKIEFGIEESFAASGASGTTMTLNTEIKTGYPFGLLKWNISLDRGQMPVGQDAIFDVQLSEDKGITWKSIFPTGNGNKIVVSSSPGAPNFGQVGIFALRGTNPGDWIKVVCLQAGTTVPGKGLQGAIF